MRQAVLADLGVDLLVGQVGVHRQTGAGEGGGDFLGVVVGVGDDGRHHCLDRREPEREAAGVLLDQDAEEAFEAAEDGAVQHDRAVAGAVLADIFGVEAFGQVGVDLQRAALPVAADGVAQDEFQLRAIEGALAGVQFVLDAGDGAGFAQRALGLVPQLRRCRCGVPAGRRT